MPKDLQRNMVLSAVIKYMCYEHLRVISFSNSGALMVNFCKLFLDTRTYHCCIQVWVI